MNRLTRDTILIRALDLVDSPSLDKKDRPSGTIVAGALSINWLQDGLDLAHNLYPEGSTVLSVAWPTGGYVAGTDTYDLPSDFIQEVEDGVLLDSDEGRLTRRNLPYLLGWKVGSTYRGKPRFYGVLRAPKSGTVGQFLIRPVPDKTRTGKLYYYALPATLAGAGVPSFPSDQCLIEYVKFKGQEWVQSVPLGTADAYMRKAIGELQAAGLGSETEPDVIKIDRNIFPGGGEPQDRNSWMGDPIIT